MSEPVLFRQQNRLCLGLPDNPEAGTLCVDFLAPAVLHRIGQRLCSESIVRAMGPRPVNAGTHPMSTGGQFINCSTHLIDATAGLGLDAFILACAGWQVTMVEQSPLVHALLADGITRGLVNADTSGQSMVLSALKRMHLMPAADSAEMLLHLPDAAVIYLDPMFPDREKSARVKKNRYLLQHLHGDEARGEHLLALALTLARKVVVKRPQHAPPLDQIKPSGSIRGKSARFDIYAGQTLTSTAE